MVNKAVRAAVAKVDKMLLTHYLHILENQRKLHRKSENIFGLKESCADNRMRKQLAGYKKKPNEIIIVLI